MSRPVFGVVTWIGLLEVATWPGAALGRHTALVLRQGQACGLPVHTRDNAHPAHDSA